MKKKVIAGLLSVAMVASFGMTGCGSGADSAASKEASASEETAESKEAEEESTEEAETLTFDNYGREITVNGTPEKVLTLGPNCTELFCALGLNDLVIGNSLNNHSRGALPEYNEAYDAIPELNHSSATREAVQTSGADFIYGLDWEFGDEGLNTEELEQFGITTYMNAASTLEEQYQEIRDIGKIFKVEDRAEEFVKDQQERIAKVEETVKDQDPVKVLVYDSGNDGVFTCGGTNFETLLIKEAGGKNIFDDQTEKQWITVSYEEAIAREPDVILIHDYDSPSVEEKIEEIKSNPVLSQLDCVKNERFATIELESVLAGDRMAYTVEKLAADFYPDLF